MAQPKSRAERVVVALGGRVVAWLLRLLGATWRLRIDPDNPIARGESFLAALWHRGLFIGIYAFRDRRLLVPVSSSRDGDRIAEVLKRLGFDPSPRGSSSRGATQVLKGLIRAAQRGATIGILCDGPRGPAGQLKPGVLAVSRATGVPVRPVGLAASPCLHFGSWDRIVLPVPFARIACSFGPPLRIPRETPRDELEHLRLQLEREVDRQQERAEAMLSARSNSPSPEGGARRWGDGCES